MIRDNKRSTIIKGSIALFFLVSVIYPLFKMFLYMGEIDIGQLLSSDQFLHALKNSLLTSITATLIAIAFSFTLSWAIYRTSIRFKALFSMALTLPMLIPSISHGMGLIILFGTNGLITNFLNLNWNIYGFWGIIIGSVMYSFPVSFLMISDVLRYEDSSPYEAAAILGFSKWDKFKAISLPYMKKPLIAVVFANFTMIVTDYGVPLMIGGKTTTLPVLMYQEVIGRLDFNKGAVLGMVLLLPALIAFLVDVLSEEKGSASFVSKTFDIRKNKISDTMAYGFIATVLFFISLPIVTFGVLTFVSKYPSNMSFTMENISNTFDLGGGKYLLNSLIMSGAVAIIGTLVAYITAYLTARMPSRLSKILHLVAISSLAIPGIVLGLAYVMSFNETAIYGTIGILILVNLVHFFASPYLMIYNTFGKINENLEAVGMTLGIGRLRIIKDVLIPQSFGTILEMISYFFVNSMITISAVSFLSNTSNRPLSLLINQFEGNMMLEASAFVSILILGANLLMKGLVYAIKRYRSKKI